MYISWKKIVVLLFVSSTLIGMDKKPLDPYDNGKAYLIETMQRGKIEHHQISEIDLMRNLIKEIDESITKISSVIKVDTDKSSGWKALEQKLSDSHSIDIEAINTLASQYSLEQLSTISTLLVTQAWIYDEIHQVSEYLAKATEAIKRCPTQLVDLVTLADAKEITTSALELIKLFIPNPTVEIEYLEHPAEIAAFMAVKHIVVKNLKQSSGLHELEVLNQLLQSPNQLINRHALFTIRHYYLQKAYSIIGRLERFLLNISLDFMNQLDCLYENVDLNGDIDTIKKMDLANNACRYVRLLVKDVGAKPITLVWDMHIGHSFDLANLLQYIAKLNFCYVCPCPTLIPDDLAQNLYVCAYDNKMRPIQLMLEADLQKYCTEFEAKKEFYTTIYSLIHQRMQNLCQGPTKRKSLTQYFKMCDLLHEKLKEQIIAQNGHPLPNQLIFKDNQVEVPASWQPAFQTPACAAACAHSDARVKAKIKKKKKNSSEIRQTTLSSQANALKILANAGSDEDYQESPVTNCNDTVQAALIEQQNTPLDTPASFKGTLEHKGKVNNQVVTTIKPLRKKKEHKKKVVKILSQPTHPKWKLDWRINRWFNTPFAENYSPDEKLYHAFPLLVNRYLRQHGIITQRSNTSHQQQVDTVYSLPGEIHYPDLQRQYAIFNCTIDPDNVCYHRGITKKSGLQMMGEFGQWILDIHDINETSTAAANGDNWRIVCHDKKHLKRYGQIIEAQQGYVKIRDSYNKVDCIIYLLDTACN